MKTHTLFLTIIFLGTLLHIQAQTATWVANGTSILNPSPIGTKVGIGTTTPSTGLHVVGSDFNLSGITIERTSGYAPALFFRNSNSGVALPISKNLGFMYFKGANGVTDGYGALITATTTEAWSTSANGSKLEFWTTQNGQATATCRLTLDQDGSLINNGSIINSGDVTIATPTAKKTLMVNGTVISNNNVLLNLNTASLAPPSQCWGAQPLMIRGNSGTDQQIFYIGQINNASNSYTYMQSQMNSNGAQKSIYLNPLGGTVAVGTINTQGYAFAVNGGILAEEVKVIIDVPASDYVFEKDYNLKSLNEVQQFVETHKHLPEVPSAAEFKRDGYKVGQMDDLLLRKVEELTLYLLAQQKEIETLKTELKTLKQ